MPFIDFNNEPHLRVWDNIHGAIRHSAVMTIAYVTLEEGAILPEHHHVHEQWANVIEGRMEFTMEGQTRVLTAGMTAFIPSNVPHSARAMTKCKVIDCFTPVREDFKVLEPWIPGLS